MNLGLIERHLLFSGTIYASFPHGIKDNIYYFICQQLKKEGFLCEKDQKLNIVLEEISDHFLLYLTGVQIKNFQNIPKHIEYDLPSVSIITPVYNSERYFSNYLNSILKLNYPREKLEVIIVDDGSQDKEGVKTFVKELKKRFKVIHISRASNMGVFFSKMEGVLSSNNNLITFFDVDDLYETFHVFLSTLHMKLLKQTGRRNFFISIPSILIDSNGYFLDIWKTRYVENPLELVAESALTLSGKISITSSIIEKNFALKIYRILNEKYGILNIVPKLSIPEDTILINQMILSDIVEKVYPVSYTGRGHVRSLSNTSKDIHRRAQEIPLQFALSICGLIRKMGNDVIMSILTNNMHILQKVILSYKSESSFLKQNLIKYLLHICSIENIDFSDVVRLISSLEAY